MEDLEIRAGLVIPADELTEAFSRSGGPGGQNVNKVASKVELRWCPGTSAALGADDRQWVLSRLARRLTAEGELVVSSSRTRDQLQNRLDARGKLAELVRRALERPTPRRATRPTRQSVTRRLEAKRRRGQVKQTRQKPEGE